MQILLKSNRTRAIARWVAAAASLILAAVSPAPADAQSAGPSFTLSASPTSGAGSTSFPASTFSFPALAMWPAAGSSGDVFFSTGPTTVTSTASSTPLPPGGQCVILGGSATNISVYSAGAVTLHAVMYTACPQMGFSGGSGGGGGGTVSCGASPGCNVTVTNATAPGQTTNASSLPVTQAYWTPLTPGQHGLPITSAVAAGSSSIAPIPANTTYATVCASGAQVKYTTDGTTIPTASIGMTLAVGSCVPLSGPTVIANFNAISATGQLDVEYFK